MRDAGRGPHRISEGHRYMILALALLGCAGPSTTELQAGGSSLPGFIETLSTTQHDGITQMEVTYPSDTLVVRGFLTLPKKSGRRPTVLFNHGGVSGVSADMKRRSIDLAKEGYVVFAPTYRGEGGSEGRIEVAVGEVADVLAAADILSRHPRVRADQMAITGSSHGALISVLAAAREPERFRCVAAACGVMDVVSWYHWLVETKGVEAVRDSLSLVVYGNGPEAEPEAFRIRQATRVAGEVKVPILLQYGEADKTVPVSQARQFVAAATSAGRPAPDLRIYPKLGHAFWFWNDTKAHTQDEIDEADDSWDDFTDFLDDHLD